MSKDYPKDGYYWINSIGSKHCFVGWIETYVYSDPVEFETRIHFHDDSIIYDEKKYRIVSDRLEPPTV